MTLQGRTIEGRYAVERPLSEGGMGTVWLGRDLKLARAVVVKVPKPELLADPRFVTRFQREVDALRRNEHPHVIPILDTGTLDGVPYVVMPYLPGGSLSERLAHRPGRRAPLGDVLAWLGPVAGALDHLHAHGLVHRDVKPANVLFDAHGRPYLTDFGIALALESATPEQRLTQTSSLMPGTPAYMAPEQALKGSISGAADQYALAVTAFEALTGTLPFRGSTAIEILVQKRSGRWVLGPDTPVPSTAVQALRRAMAQEPAKRFGSCAAFLAALGAADAAPGAAAQPRGARARAAGTPLWRALAPAGALLVVGVAALLLLTSGGGDAPPAPPPPAPPEPAPALAARPTPPPEGGPKAPTPAADPKPKPAPEPRPAPEPKAPPSAAPGPAPGPAPSSAGVPLTVEEPQEGARVNDTVLTVSGAVRGSARVVYIGTRAVPVQDGRFTVELDLEHEDDGEKTLEIGTSIGQPLVVRHVVLDRNPPRVVVTLRPLGLPQDRTPVQGKEVLYLPEAPSYEVSVRVHDVSPVTVRAALLPRLALRSADAPPSGALAPLALDADGTAQWVWSRGALRMATLHVTAHDAGDLDAVKAVPLLVVPRLGPAYPLERTSPRGGGLWRPFLRLHPVLQSEEVELLVSSPARDQAGSPRQEILGLAGGSWLHELAPREMDQPLVATAMLRLAGRTEPTARLPGPELSILRAPSGPGSAAPPGPASAQAPPEGWRLLTGRHGGLAVPLEAAAPMTIEARLRCLDRARPACRLLSGVGPEGLDLTLDATGKSLTLSAGGRADGAPKWAFPAPALDEWMHVALVLEPERSAVYLNGRLLGTRVHRRGEARNPQRTFVVCRPDPDGNAAPRDGACTYELGAVRVTRDRRFVAEFSPPRDLAQDAATTLLYRPGPLEERAWWGAGELALPALPAGPGRLLPEPAAGRAGSARAGTSLFLSGSGWIFWNVDRGPGDLTLEARVRRPLGWGQHVVLSCPELDLCLEDGVPVVYARVAGRGALSGDDLRVTSPDALDPGHGWVRLSVCRKDRLVTLYVAGRPVASGTLPAAPAAPQGIWALGLGGLPSNPPAFVGEVDDVRVSHGARHTGPYDPDAPVVPDADTLFLAGCESELRPLEGWAPGDPKQASASGGVLLQVPQAEGAKPR